MNCLACRRTLLIQPHDRSDELAAHLRSCATCARLARQQARFEQQLDAALRVPVPENLRERVRFAASMRRRSPWRWLAVAAVVVAMVTGLGLGGWEYRTSQQLSQAMAVRIRAVSPDAVGGTDIADPRLARMAARIRAYLAANDMGRIVSVNEDWVRGQRAAQFVVRHGAEQARIFMLPGAWLAMTHNVAAGDMPGKLIPTADGIIAVFCPDRGMLAHVAAAMSDSLAQPG